MEANQDEVNNLNKMIDEIMRDNVEAVEEAQSETQPKGEVNAEKGNQPERVETEEEKDFVSPEAKELWNKVMHDKDFSCERGFGKLISPFSEVITKRG